MIASGLLFIGFCFLTLVVLGLCKWATDLDARLKAIETADAEAEGVVDVWYTQAPATVTEKGPES